LMAAAALARLTLWTKLEWLNLIGNPAAVGDEYKALLGALKPPSLRFVDHREGGEWESEGSGSDED
jgi:hypothetical protein